MGERLFYYLATLDDSGDSDQIGDVDLEASQRKLVSDPAQANLVSSLCDDGLHRPVLDVDTMPAWRAVAEVVDAWRTVFIDGRLPAERFDVEPSSTEGHCHVFVNSSIRWGDYCDLLVELARRGVIEPGYRDASLAREQTFVRRPGVYKQKAA